MDRQIDLTAESDGDDHDLQAAIRASLHSTIDGGGGGGGGSGCGGNATSDQNESFRKSATCTSSKRQKLRGPAEHETERKGKRPRVEKEHASSPSDQEPFLFRLISTPTDKAGSGSVSLADLLSGDFQEALLTNYMVDIQLLLEAQPRLASVPVVLVHGFKDNSPDERTLHMECASVNRGIKLHHPQLQQFGTHHAKMMVLKFKRGVRVIVLTANFVRQDVSGKSQGVWYQDFPLRASGTCDFEDTLVEYLEKIGGPAAEYGRTLRRYDFGLARVALVPSVPSIKVKHKGPQLHKYGHMRVRELLSRERVLLKEGGHKVIFQFSSLASLTKAPDDWLMELLSSFMPQEANTSGVARGKVAVPPAGSSAGALSSGAKLKEHLRVVWPSVQEIRGSSQGWAAGGSIPCKTQEMFGGEYNRPDMARFRANDPRPELRPLLRKWEGDPAVNRAGASPHIKSYLRYREVPAENGREARVDGDEVAWFLLTSSNLSRSAWGVLHKDSKELMVRSFEMGVMFLPSLLGRKPHTSDKDGAGDGSDSIDRDSSGTSFTCTPGEMGLTQRFPLGYVCQAGKALPLKMLPLPYRVPAPRYRFDKGDKPWVWDRNYTTPDAFGKMWTPNGGN